ncbi:MAG: glutamate--tRNA ligase, partial [Acetobacteraceae bacterium]
MRFAPSPTGLLHVGNARIALLNFLFAKRHGGEFLLRLDDTDKERSRPEYAATILADLAWLGLSWAGPARQSERLARYTEVAEELKASGRLYACYETEAELAAKRAARAARGLPPLYDRAGLRLGESGRKSAEAAGMRPHWRFRLSDRTVAWQDLVLGDRHVPLSTLSDPVLIRADGSPLYTFSSIVDDRDLGITHIIRGADHVTNTAVQVDIWEARDSRIAPPAFAHLPLLADETGGKLSKRAQSLSIRALEEEGIEAPALVNYLARLGAGSDAAPATLE